MFSCLYHPLLPKIPWFSDLISLQKFSAEVAKCYGESQAQADEGLGRGESCLCAPALS